MFLLNMAINNKPPPPPHRHFFKKSTARIWIVLAANFDGRPRRRCAGNVAVDASYQCPGLEKDGYLFRVRSLVNAFSPFFLSFLSNILHCNQKKERSPCIEVYLTDSTRSARVPATVQTAVFFCFPSFFSY